MTRSRNVRLRPLMLTLAVVAGLPATATAAAPGDTLLASGLPGLGAAGTLKVTFSGRFGRRGLSSGRYRFSLVAIARACAPRP